MTTGSDTPPSDTTIHATTVAHAGGAVLIRGAAGSGKSTLALQMIALGARLIADDRTILHRRGAYVIARCPDTIRGQIEARGVGIMAAPVADPTAVMLIVDLDARETDRLPPWRSDTLLGVELPLLRNVELPHFPAALLSYLEHGRLA